MTEQGPVLEKTRQIHIDAQAFDAFMEAHKNELAERFGQNPDILIERDEIECEVIITELPSKNRKQSMIDLITKATQEEE